jgi:hypothetical protein
MATASDEEFDYHVDQGLTQVDQAVLQFLAEAVAAVSRKPAEVWELGQHMVGTAAAAALGNSSSSSSSSSRMVKMGQDGHEQVRGGCWEGRVWGVPSARFLERTTRLE